MSADDLFSEDPMKLMPRLRQIHKLGDFPAGQGPEDRDNMNAPSNKEKARQPGKIKHAAGFMSSMMGIPSMSEQYYMSGMGETGDEENMPIELLSMAGPQIARGAQMAQMANRLAKRPTRRMVQRRAERATDGVRILGALKRNMPKTGSVIEKKAYKLQGHTNVQGIPIAIENRKGSVRSGTDKDGHKWHTKMKMPYGYIKGTKGADGEPVDAFIGPDKEAPNAFVVHQHKDTGKGYDEDKVILGHKTKADAKKAYLQHYDDPKFLGPIARVSTARLKELVASKKKLVKISQVSYRAMLDELMTKEAAVNVIRRHKRTV